MIDSPLRRTLTDVRLPMNACMLSRVSCLRVSVLPTRPSFFFSSSREGVSSVHHPLGLSHTVSANVVLWLESLYDIFAALFAQIDWTEQREADEVKIVHKC